VASIPLKLGAGHHRKTAERQPLRPCFSVDTPRATEVAGEFITSSQPDVVLSSTTSTTDVNHIHHRGAAATDAHYPIIFGTVADPVGSGLVASLPGGHATGFTNIEGSIAGKWLELLKQIARASTVSPCRSIRQPHPTPKFILALSGPRRLLSPWRRSPRLWAIRPNSNARLAVLW
jgi:hypothetical protein